jgi:hypothetical protein
MKSKRAPVAVLWVAVAVAAAILTAQALPTTPSNAAEAGFGSVRPAAPPARPAPEPKLFDAFADAAGLTVRLPMRHPVGVLFHEALSPGAIPMSPYGKLKVTANPRFNAGPAVGDLPYFVMASRGRGTASTSAVDIVTQAGSVLYAPVTGTVVRVSSYWLYGAYPDIRVEIRPDSNAAIRVVMIHLERVVFVGVGQHVEASVTPIGKPRVLPFHSQTDTYTHTHDPHVHLEIHRVA